MHGMSWWRVRIYLEICVYRWYDEMRKRLWVCIIIKIEGGFCVKGWEKYIILLLHFLGLKWISHSSPSTPQNPRSISLKFPLLFLSSFPNSSLFSLSLSLTGRTTAGRPWARPRAARRGRSRGGTDDIQGGGGQRVFLWIYRWGSPSWFWFKTSFELIFSCT